MEIFLYLIIFVILVILFFMLFYISKKISKFSFVKSINNKLLYWFTLSIPFIIFTVFLCFDMVNTYIALLHFFFIILFGYIIYYFVRKLSKKDYRYGNEITFMSSFLLTVIYLSYAYVVCHTVVETNYTLYTNKDIGDDFRIVQITDSHVGATMSGDDFYNYMLEINKVNPDIVVVTGDYVDDDTMLKDMVRACEGLGALKSKYGVYYVYGNHDKGYFTYRGYNDDDLRDNLTKNNVVILEDETVGITDKIYLTGRQDRREKDRVSASQLVSNLDKEKYLILLDHEPNDYKNEKNAGFDLVISGHTHGGQLIPIKYFDMLVGANDMVYGMRKDGDTTFIVSSGIGDWAVKFRTASKSEYVVIDIKKSEI